MLQHRFCLWFGQHCSQRGGVGLLYGAHAAKVLQEPLPCALAHAWDFQQLGFTVAHLPPLAVERHGKAM